MKTIKVTRENANWVFSKLNKFFSHKNFIVWHQFNGGMKKRIGHIIKSSSGPFDVMRPYYNIQTEIKHLYHAPQIPIFYVDMNEVEGFCIVADGSTEIGFFGNRIIIKEKWSLVNSHMYQCFQILK